MQNLNRKINGEEAPKTFLRGCRACVFQCGRVGVCLRHSHHFASYHHIISHNITSYIILHQRHETWIRSWSSAHASSKQKGAKARSKLQEIQFYQLCCKKVSLFTEHGYLSLRSTDLFFTKHEKKGRCFFAEGSKMVCVQNFMHRKEINCNNLHIPNIT
jgi:hypothetical protein